MANEMRESNISEMITGLKAVQREAKEATRALKEFAVVQGIDFAKGSDYTAVRGSEYLKRKRVLICGINKAHEGQMKRSLTSWPLVKIPEHQVLCSNGRIDGLRGKDLIVVTGKGRNDEPLLVSNQAIKQYQQEGATIVDHETFVALWDAFTNFKE